MVAVSDYDAAVKGYHVALAGCVACSKPVTIGQAKEPRFVTLKVPDKDADSLTKAVSLSRNTFGFDSLADAKRWLDAERPFLRAEFLFQPQIVGDVWTFGAEPRRGAEAGRARASTTAARATCWCRSRRRRRWPSARPRAARTRPAPPAEARRRDGRRRRPPSDDLPAQLTQDADRRRDGEDPAAGVRLLPAVQVAGHAGAHLRRRRATAPCSRSRSVPRSRGRRPACACCRRRRTPTSRRSRSTQQKFTYPFFLRQ